MTEWKEYKLGATMGEKKYKFNEKTLNHGR